MNSLNNIRWKRLLKLFLLLIFFAGIVYAISFFTGDKFGAIKEALLPPKLPQAVQINRQEWLGPKQSWSETETTKYHYLSQGTRTIPIPYEWFINLERPAESLLGILFSSDKKLRDD